MCPPPCKTAAYSSRTELQNHEKTHTYKRKMKSNSQPLAPTIIRAFSTQDTEQTYFPSINDWIKNVPPTCELNQGNNRHKAGESPWGSNLSQGTTCNKGCREWEKSSSQGRVHQTGNPIRNRVENIHTRNIICSEQAILRNTYICTCMHVKAINKKAMDLEETKEYVWEDLEKGKWRDKWCNYINLKNKRNKKLYYHTCWENFSIIEKKKALQSTTIWLNTRPFT